MQGDGSRETVGRVEDLLWQHVSQYYSCNSETVAAAAAVQLSSVGYYTWVQPILFFVLLFNDNDMIDHRAPLHNCFRIWYECPLKMHFIIITTIIRAIALDLSFPQSCPQKETKRSGKKPPLHKCKEERFRCFDLQIITLKATFPISFFFSRLGCFTSREQQPCYWHSAPCWLDMHWQFGVPRPGSGAVSMAGDKAVFVTSWWKTEVILKLQLQSKKKKPKNCTFLLMWLHVVLLSFLETLLKPWKTCLAEPDKPRRFFFFFFLFCFFPPLFLLPSLSTEKQDWSENLPWLRWWL